MLNTMTRTAYRLATALAGIPMMIPTTAAAPERAVVTFAVGPETYRVQLVNADDIAHAEDLLAGRTRQRRLAIGLVVRKDPSVNAPWSWHIDPASVRFADMATEVCDGRPSGVERGTITSKYFCPYLNKVIAVTPN